MLNHAYAEYGPDQQMHRAATWPELWAQMKVHLLECGYSRSTLVLYRQVLRQFRAYCRTSSSSVGSELIGHYIDSLVDRHSSWSWIGTNISVLRTAFDKVGGRNLTANMVTPKRGRTLPDILSQSEVDCILNAATTIRDQLLLGLMYGCGLKVAELSTLRWEDVDIAKKRLSIPGGRQFLARSLILPNALIPVLEEGVSRCEGTDYIFAGRQEGRHLSCRMIELILRKAVDATETTKLVTCMTMRHSYAVHRLEMGATIREVQESLGHKSIHTTMRYQYCIAPQNINVLSKVRELYPPDNEAGNASELQATSGRPSCREPRDLVSAPNLSLLAALELPFRDETSTPRDRAIDFLRSLKTQITGRFLGRRKANSP